MNSETLKMVLIIISINEYFCGCIVVCGLASDDPPRASAIR